MKNYCVKLKGTSKQVSVRAEKIERTDSDLRALDQDGQEVAWFERKSVTGWWLEETPSDSLKELVAALNAPSATEPSE